MLVQYGNDGEVREEKHGNERTFGMAAEDVLGLPSSMAPT